MKIVKNNIFNKIFHNSTVRECKAFASKCIKRFQNAPELLNKIKDCNSLTQLVELHKEAFSKGFDSNNLDVDPFGMFRAKSIESMQPKDVYLGGIYGLNTLNIPGWVENKDDIYGYDAFGISFDTPIHDIVLKQYKDFLLQNIMFLSQTAKFSYKKLEEMGYVEN